MSTKKIKKAPVKEINFMGVRKAALVVSLTLIVISILSLAIRGLNFGVDFTGGTVMEMSYPENAVPDKVRIQLEKAGFEKFSVSRYGSLEKILVRMSPQETKHEIARKDAAADRAALSNRVLETLRVGEPGVRMDRVEFVGPQIGEELREKGGIAMLIALASILIYVGLRFEFRFSVSSVIALLHDVIITLGFFSITGFDFDLTVLAAILAIIGYSLNDTIVVFDRVRENFRLLRKGEPEEIVNTSVNQTLTRTIVTSLTTLLVLLALFFFGGVAVNAFSMAMIVGVIIGTYSSVYVASSSLLMMGITKEALIPPEKEGEDELLDMP